MDEVALGAEGGDRLAERRGAELEAVVGHHRLEPPAARRELTAAPLGEGEVQRAEGLPSPAAAGRRVDAEGAAGGAYADFSASEKTRNRKRNRASSVVNGGEMSRNLGIGQVRPKR